MKDNIMFIPTVILMAVEVVAMGFLAWEWIKAKRRNKNGS